MCSIVTISNFNYNHRKYEYTILIATSMLISGEKHFHISQLNIIHLLVFISYRKIQYIHIY